MLKNPVTAADHIQGDASAPVVLVEYGDYQCPHCGHAYPIVKRVQKHFGKRLAFVFRNFPLNEIHPEAEDAAETAEFAGANQKFWDMHDRLFANQRELTRPDLSKHAQAIGLNVGTFDQCLDSGKSVARVRKDLADAEKLQANGTPTFFVGLTEGNGSPIKGTRIVGAVPYQTFKETIDKLLASQK